MSNLSQTCRECKEQKSLEEFPVARSNVSGRSFLCLVCVRKYNAKYYQRNREKLVQNQRDYAAHNKERIAAYRKEWNRKNTAYVREKNLRIQYGITISDYNEMLERQCGVCAICQCEEKSNRNSVLSVDHCHDTGKIRGLLCNNCNRAVGLIGDKLEIARRMVDYLEDSSIDR